MSFSQKRSKCFFIERRNRCESWVSVKKGTIKLNDEGNILDKSKSKFILNTNKSSILGEESYTKGSSIETQTQGIQND